MKLNTKKYIIGVSGGPDSMYLMHKYRSQIKAVCHVNYHMRKTAERDFEIVKTACKKYNLPLYVKDYDFQKDSLKNRNFQTRARKFRYDFMARIANQKECDAILVAHHLDDFIETAWMQKTKNSNSLFLGIRKWSSYKNIKIYRPLLNIRKQFIVDACNTLKINYGIDESNFNPKYKRNQIRLLINKWSEETFHNFYLQIKTFNEVNYKRARKIRIFYDNWKTKLFVGDLKTRTKEFVFHVIYLLLLDKFIKPSKNKIDMIIDFMKHNNPTKRMRLGNEMFLTVENNRLSFNFNF